MRSREVVRTVYCFGLLYFVRRLPLGLVVFSRCGRHVLLARMRVMEADRVLGYPVTVTEADACSDNTDRRGCATNRF